MPQEILPFTAEPLEPTVVEMWFQNNITAGVGQWLVVPRLKCRDFRATVQPISGISGATLTYDYGILDTEDGLGFNAAPGHPGFFAVPPLGVSDSALEKLNPYVSPTQNLLLHRFIRVGVYNNDTGVYDTFFCGVINNTQDQEFKQPRPPATDLDSVQARGRQVLQATGPEWLLNRRQILSSRVWHTGDGAARTVPRGIPFNARRGRVADGNAEQHGNRRNALGPANDRYSFGTNESDLTFWNATRIVQYVEDNHLPRTLDLDVAPPHTSPTINWEVANEAILGAQFPQVDAHGKTVYALFNELAPPQRFFNWDVRYNNLGPATFGTFTIEFNTASAQPITLPSGTIIAANPRQKTLNTSGTIDGRVTLTGDSTNEYLQVLCLGAKQGFVGTFKVMGDFLKKGWTAADETAYKAGVTPPDANPTPQEIQDFNDNFRSNEYGHVFTRFVCPSEADLGAVVNHNVYVPDLRFERTIPLFEFWNYGVNPPVARASTEARRPEFRKLFSIYKYAPKGTRQLERYGYGDKLSGQLQTDGFTKGQKSSVTIRPLEETVGVELTPGSAQPHWQAKDESGIANETEPMGTVDFNNDIQVTGYFQSDQYAFGVWPVTPNVTDNASTLVIQMGDNFRYDQLLKDTVVEIVGGERVLAPATIALPQRDDRELLADIARFAYQWYCIRRYAYTVTYSQITRDLRPGDMAVNIDGATTDAIISEVNFDFVEGVTRVATAYAEPDFKALGTEARFTRATRV